MKVRRLSQTVRCQRVLTDAGYPCPRRCDGPSATEAHVAMLESRLDRGERGDAHQPRVRLAMARSLAEHVELAAHAAGVLGPRHAPDVIGHSDWVCHRDAYLRQRW